jgi:hypothetical protein
VFWTADSVLCVARSPGIHAVGVGPLPTPSARPGRATNVAALLEAIDLMVEQQRILTALILIYAGIDAIASLERRESDRTGRAGFLRWVDTFLLRDGRLPCTALELYGSRCGILHTFSADSDLSRSGKYAASCTLGATAFRGARSTRRCAASRRPTWLHSI